MASVANPLTWLDPLLAEIDQRIPPNLLADPDVSRRAHLITRFGVQGSIFGIIYALFYLMLGHYYGASIIAWCTIGVACTPMLMLWTKSTQPAGHFFSLVLTLGFLGLCCCEGGVHGHAIAWLVSVPLCALLLLGVRGSILWVSVAFLAAAIVAGCDLAGIKLPTTYAPEWDGIITAAGYLGLVIFMSLLGFVFENGRARAYRKLQAALQELRETNETLIALNQEKTEFLGIAAHDLKNPLSAIMASGELMREFDDPETLHQISDNVLAASQRMHRLIMDLLESNAIEEGRYTAKIESCDLGKHVTQIVEQNRIAAAKKQIKIQLGVPEAFIIRTDANATLQILDNLISNAVKYSPQNTTVHVHIMPEKENAVVQVRDEGPGISEEDQKKLFQKYSRLTARPTGGESSTGLGLSIAKRLAISLGGDIICRSALGAGTTFALRLPITAQPVPAITAHDATDIIREKQTLAPHRN